MKRIIVLLALLSAQVNAQESDIAPSAMSKIRIDFSGTFTHFEQQLKTEIGGTKGELLIADTELALQLAATYQVNNYLSIGWYVQQDVGNRENAQFSMFDTKGATQVANLQGGRFNEFWTGPLVRGHYKQMFVELGYGLVGIRSDKARAAILKEDGTTDGDFSTSPTIAWMSSLGVNSPLTEKLDLLLKLQYRVRYYDSKGGQNLANKAVHGTQNFTPMLGLVYRL